MKSKLLGDLVVQEISEKLIVWGLLTGRTFPQGRRNHDLKYSFPEKAEGFTKISYPEGHDMSAVLRYNLHRSTYIHTYDHR